MQKKFTVTEFAKKTGDYPSLQPQTSRSGSDLSTGNRECGNWAFEERTWEKGTDDWLIQILFHIHSHLFFNICLFAFQVQICSTKRHPETPVGIAGFHFPSKVRHYLQMRVLYLSNVIVNEYPWCFYRKKQIYIDSRWLCRYVIIIMSIYL